MSDDRFDLTRRKILGGMGALGVASAGAGFGTSAYFNDEESFDDNALTAGELDLKVDWEEYYYRDTDGAEYVNYSQPTDTSGYIGLPDPDNPLVWVSTDDLGNFMAETALEAYPDTDGDGTQDSFAANPGGEINGVGYICDDGADTAADLDPTGDGLRTLNADTLRNYEAYVNTDAAPDVAPLIDLDDIKPGDFGEATLSFHLCDNPGYVWLRGDLVEAAENGHTEPERTSTTEEGDGDEVSGPATLAESDVELLDAIQTVIWYDTDGDNVFDSTETLIARGSLREVLQALRPDDDPGIRLNPRGFAVDQFQDDIDSNTAAIACSALGKVEYDDNTGEFSADSPNARVTTQLDVTYDSGDVRVETQPVFEFDIDTTGAQETVTVTLENIEFKDDEAPDKGEIIEFDVVVTSPATIGLCGLDVKGGGGPTPKEITTEGCVSELTDVSPPEITVGSGNTQQTGLSNLQFYYCETDGDTDDGNGEPCFPASEDWYVGFAWYLPVDYGNEVQTDAVSFDLGFYTEQCRHNDGLGSDGTGT